MKRPQGTFYYLAGVDEVVVEARFPHGSGTTKRAIVLPVDRLAAVADALRRFPQNRWAHALRHIERGEALPCGACRDVASDHLAKIRGASRVELVAVVERLAEIFYPGGEEAHACGADEIGAIANLMHERGFTPEKDGEAGPCE